MDRNRLILVGALGVVAILIFTQGRRFMTPAPVEVPTVAQPVVEKIEYVDVLVATEEIQFGSRLSETQMKWKQWPAEAASEEFITNENQPQAISELTSSVVRSVIYQGEPITEKKIVKAGEQGLMASLLSSGMRAVTTRISVDTAAGGFIQPGDHVDIILTMSAPTSVGVNSGGNLFTAQTIFENVRVLAIDQTFSTNSESGATVIGSTATFEMSQADAEILQQSVAQGDLTLTLRPFGRAGDYPGRSHAKIEANSGGEVSSLTVYRNGQPQQVAVTGN